MERNHNSWHSNAFHKVPYFILDQHTSARAVSPKMSLLFNSLSRTLIRPLMAKSVEIQPPSYLWTALRFKGGVKTNSGAKKRFRLRGSGSIKRYELCCLFLTHPHEFQLVWSHMIMYCILKFVQTTIGNFSQ